MTDRQAFNKKLFYVAALVPLMLVLRWLGRPESTDAAGKVKGGVLAEMRHEYRLSQSNLGEVDPVSESYKLATLGFRPIAVVLLWEKSNHYKKVEDWSNFEATLKQITYLQPNFIKVLDYQAHNLAFNISAELDDWRDRYYYVVKGLKFLISGTHYNANDSLLLNRIGWFIAQKIGRSDEKVLYRKRFAQDTDLHEYLDHELDQAAGRTTAGDVAEKQPDNTKLVEKTPAADARAKRERDSWLVSKDWYRVAENAVDRGLSQIRGESRVIFYSHAPMSQIFYARVLEEEGKFDDLEKIRRGWQTAKADWTALSVREFASYEGWPFHLNDQEDLEAKAAQVRKQLDDMAGADVRASLRNAKIAKLSPAESQALFKPENQRTPEEMQAASQLESRVEVSDAEVAINAPQDKRAAAIRLAYQVGELAARAQSISSFREHINFVYWRLRCEGELSDELLTARRLSAQARREQKDSSLTDETKQTFEDAFVQWRRSMDKFPKLFADELATDDIFETIQDYQRLLRDRNNGEKLPEKFILQDVVDMHEHK